MNKFLEPGQVVVALDDIYCNSNGSMLVAWVFDGEKVWEHVYSSGYSEFNHASVNCSKEQFDLAVIAYQKQRLSTKIIGSTVILSRSRKAPNGVELEVVGYEPGYINRYNQKTPNQIRVLTEDGAVWVNQSCIKEIVLGPKPWWAN